MARQEIIKAVQDRENELNTIQNTVALLGTVINPTLHKEPKFFIIR